MPKSKRKLRRRAILAALGTCIAVFALTGIAQAETLTLGAALTGTKASPAFCSPVGEGACGEMTVTAVAPSVGTRSPVNGTVVGWRIRGSSATPGYKLNVLRDNGDDSYTVTASTGSVTPAGNEIETLASSLPIHIGEYLELDIPYSGHIAQVEGESTNAFFPPTAEVGETATTGAGEIPFVFGYNADIESESSPASPASPAPPRSSVPPALPNATSPPAPAAEAHCVVPKLKGKKIKAARKTLTKADCKLGKVKGHKGKSAKVKKQSPKPGEVLAPGGKVRVTVK